MRLSKGVFMLHNFITRNFICQLSFLLATVCLCNSIICYVNSISKDFFSPFWVVLYSNLQNWQDEICGCYNFSDVQHEVVAIIDKAPRLSRVQKRAILVLIYAVVNTKYIDTISVISLYNLFIWHHINEYSNVIWKCSCSLSLFLYLYHLGHH